MSNDVLLLRLAGPLQSWGDSSRFNRRETRTEPTKSGVIGILASAQGRTREDSIEDLLDISFGIRIDQRGNLLHDFQTEHPWQYDKKTGNWKREEKESLSPTNRYYLSDAKFLVAIGAPREVLDGLSDALKHPKWSLFLGRRSCPPDFPLNLGVQDKYEGIRDALEHYEWQAAPWYRKCYGYPKLEIVCDALPKEAGVSQSDMPLSFSQMHRKYAERPVHRYMIPNPDKDRDKNHMAQSVPTAHFADIEHDPMNFA